LVPALPQSEWIESARGEPAERILECVNGASLSDLLDVLVRTAIQKSQGGARAAFYIANGNTLHHVTGMSEAYAKYVDGFVIGPQSLACGLSAATGKPIITRDVAEEPLWKPWLGSPISLAIALVGHFRFRARKERSSVPSRCITRSHVRLPLVTLISLPR